MKIRCLPMFAEMGKRLLGNSPMCRRRGEVHGYVRSVAGHFEMRDTPTAQYFATSMMQNRLRKWDVAVSAVMLAVVVPYLGNRLVAHVYGDTPYVNGPIHELLEAIGCGIALIVAKLLHLGADYESQRQHIYWRALGLMAMGIMDGAHAVAAHPAAWSWLRIGATLTGGILFGMVWCPMPRLVLRHTSIAMWVFVLFVGAITTGIYLGADALPVRSPHGSPPSLEGIAISLGTAGFLAAAAHSFLGYIREGRRKDLVLSCHALLFATAGFLVDFSDAWTAGWWNWHVIRLLAYVGLLVASYQDIARLYRSAARQSRQLQTQVEIRTAELQLAQEAARVGTFEWDLQRNRLRWTPQLEALYGLTPGDFTGTLEQWRQLIHPEDWSQAARAHHEAIRHKARLDDEFRIVWPDGAVRWVAARGHVIVDSSGKAVRLVGANIDITERRHAEEARRESEERMQQALRVSRSFTFEWDPRTDQVVRSASCAGILKLDGDKAVLDTGANFIQRLRPAAREPFQEVLRKLSPDSSSYVTEYSVDCGDGSVAVLEEVGQASFDEQGTMVRLVGVSTDVTERKSMDDALRRSQADLDRAESVGQIGWWRLDTRRNVLTWSRENHRIFDVPEGQPLSYESFLSIVHPDDREYVGEQWAAALRGEPYDIEHRIVVHDGIKWVRERAYLETDDQGAILGGFGITQDISARKLAEETLRKTTERFALLSEMAAALLSSSTPQAILESLCRRVMFHLDCDVFFNYLADEPARRLHLNACAGIPQDEARKIEWLDYGVAVCGCVARDRFPLIMEDVANSQDPRVRLIQTFGVQAYCCHPLVSGRRLLGTLSFGCKRRTCFTPDETDWLRAVADQVAVAMERIRGDEALRRSESRWNAAIERFAEGAMIATEDERIIYCNPAARVMHGFTSDSDCLGPVGALVNTFELWTADKSQLLRADEWPLRRVKNGEVVRNLELCVRRKDQNWEKYFSFSGVKVETAGNEKLIFMSISDLSELRQTEIALRATLQEKEVLLKEVHHRVKNNMQVISSLVSLQAARRRDVAMRQVLQDVSHRVRSMALVHEKLYQSADLASVEFAEYTRGLLAYLWRSQGNDLSHIQLLTDVEPVSLSVNSAVPCGLILNELVSNALKHAFRGRAEGLVSVSLSNGEDGRISLCVRDNGVGFPPELNWQETDSLGLHIVRILASQIHATVEVHSNTGAAVTVTLPDRGDA